DGFYCNRLAKLALQKIAAYVQARLLTVLCVFLMKRRDIQFCPETRRGVASFVKGRTIKDVECFI
ncbi:MAG: hypothetical protein IJ485_00575, partial [Lachnospiraceae bacterium]|nr:hypothetical protein [Lachnospiraceae bacterium]